MLVSCQGARLVACTFLVAPFLLTYPWKPSNVFACAFLVPPKSCPIIEKKVRGTRCSSRIRQRRLSLAPGTAAATPPPPPSTAELDTKLSGKEAVDQAAQRLVPLFAEVDAHTQL